MDERLFEIAQEEYLRQLNNYLTLNKKKRISSYQNLIDRLVNDPEIQKLLKKYLGDKQ